MDTFLTLLAAMASAAAAAFAAKYALDAVKATRATLFGQFIQEYSEDSMGADMECLRQWQRKHGSKFGDAYLEGLSGGSPTDEVNNVKQARRRVSQYFKKLARLNDADLIDKVTLAKLYGWRPFAFCLEVLAPLDDAHHQYVTSKPDDRRWREFYQQVYDEAKKIGKE